MHSIRTAPTSLSLDSQCFASHFRTVRHSAPLSLSPLRKAGLKSTPGRRAVLSVLAKLNSPASADQIYTKVGTQTCDRATVYRILDSLDEAGLLQRVIVRGKKLYLPEEPSHHHHHVVCRKCNSTVCLDQCLISPLEKKSPPTRLPQHPSHPATHWSLLQVHDLDLKLSALGSEVKFQFHRKEPNTSNS